jgi:hypothetical protein
MFSDAPIVSDKTLESIDNANHKVETFTAKLASLRAEMMGMSIDLFNKTKGWEAGPVGAALYQLLNQEPNKPMVPPSELPAPDVQALINSQKSIAESSLGSGVIGVGASPQIAMQQEANDKLASIDSHLAELVRGNTDVDFTKGIERYKTSFPR